MLDPIDVGRMVRSAIERNDPWVFTHPEWLGANLDHAQGVLDAIREAAGAGEDPRRRRRSAVGCAATTTTRGKHMEIAGKVAVITGGGSGIGRGVGTLFAERGMKVVLADMNAEVLDATVADLQAKGHEVTGVPTDVADFDAVKHLADVAFDTHGNVHVLMNNAGTGGGGTFDDADMTQWRRAIGVNIEGTLHGILAFMPRMLANDEEGYITGTTSGSGAQGTMYSGAPYAATKNAVLSLMESLYGYLRDRGSKLHAACLFPPLDALGHGQPDRRRHVEGRGRARRARRARGARAGRRRGHREQRVLVEPDTGPGRALLRRSPQGDPRVAGRDDHEEGARHDRPDPA